MPDETNYCDKCRRERDGDANTILLSTYSLLSTMVLPRLGGEWDIKISDGGWHASHWIGPGYFYCLHKIVSSVYLQFDCKLSQVWLVACCLFVMRKGAKNSSWSARSIRITVLDLIPIRTLAENLEYGRRAGVYDVKVLCKLQRTL